MAGQCSDGSPGIGRYPESQHSGKKSSSNLDYLEGLDDASSANVERLLGREGFLDVRRRIVEQYGKYPPLDTFPIHDAVNLRPYHRFDDPTLYDKDLFSLVRSNYANYPGKQARVIGSDAFFAEIDQRAEAMDRRDRGVPLPIALRRHPTLIHFHLFMAHRKTFREMSDVVFFYQDKVKAISPVHNPIHRELRALITCLLYVIGRFDQAASYGDLRTCVTCLDLMDNLATSLRGLCEVDYSVREEANKAGIW